ncbi:MAG: universal stress protein [Nitrosomonadales bacterium]|nr:universal stress protein [Nitrosomonadales bacterium]
MYKRIAVAVDGSKTSDKALREAVGLAGEMGATILLIHVCEEMPAMWEPGGISMMPSQEIMRAIAAAGEALLENRKARVAGQGVPVEARLAETFGGRVGVVLAEEAQKWNADLLVAGTHGRKGVDRILMGSAADGAARAATMPVLLVRGEN